MAAASAGDGLAHPLAPSALKELEKAMRPGTSRATVTESNYDSKGESHRVYCGSWEEELLGKYYKAHD